MKARQALLAALVAAVTLTAVALAFAVPAAADPPTVVQWKVEFPDVNPCTGDLHTVTIAGTTSVHDHDGRIVAYSERTITTSSGFVGRGTDTSVDNGQVFVFRHLDILTNASGDRMTARVVFVLDVSTGTARVEKFELTCLGPG
jgi:hypothetical protein